MARTSWSLEFEISDMDGWTEKEFARWAARVLDRALERTVGHVVTVCNITARKLQSHRAQETKSDE